MIMKETIFFISILACCVCGTYSLVSRGIWQVEEPGKYKFTAYLGIMYKSGKTSNSCGKINTKAGYLFFEALRFAVNLINKNSSYLYGGRLGYRALNTCKNTLILRDQVSAGILDPNAVAVLGPPTSDEAVFVTPIFHIFGIPVISHLATGIDLEDRQRYSNFYRTVPSDSDQLSAFLDILKTFNWTYIYAFNSLGNFGEHGMLAFEALIRPTNICIAERITLSRRTNRAYYRALMEALKREKNVKVVVLYTTLEDTLRLLSAAKEAGIRRGDYIWIGTASFGVALREEFMEVADGALFLGYEEKGEDDFLEYLKTLSPRTETFPWFRMFWESIFNCSLAVNATKRCTKTESIESTSVFRGHEPVNVVISAVNTIACGIKTALDHLCPNETTRSQCLRDPVKVMGVKLRYQMRFAFAKKLVNCGKPFPSAKFGDDGSTPGYFSLLNVQYHNGKSAVVNVGYWKEGSHGFTFNQRRVQFGNGTNRVPPSVCAMMCKPGEIRVPVFNNPKCCWRCVQCTENQYISNNTCMNCPQYYVPTNDRKLCRPLPLDFVKIGSTLSIAILIFCFIGVKLTTVTFGVLLKYWDTRIVKASSRELSMVMIVGLYICFLTPIIFIAEPTAFVCGVRRFIFGVSLTTCYTPLLLKTLRIYRIFTSAQRGLKRPTFVSPRAQVIACLAFISLQCLLGVAWIAGNSPTVALIVAADGTYVHKACTQNTISMVFNLTLCCLLMLVCTFFAVKTRKFPKNYNESKSIGVTMYLTCLLWGIFIPMYAYAASDGRRRVYHLSIFCLLISFVTLLGLFGHRVYLLLFTKGVSSDDASQTSTSGKSSYNHTNLKVAKLTTSKLAMCTCPVHGQGQDASRKLDLSTETDNDEI